MLGIQVTAGQETIQDLSCWKSHFEGKGIKTFTIKNKSEKFELWREMIPQDSEKRGIEHKELKPMACSSQDKVYGRG